MNGFVKIAFSVCLILQVLVGPVLAAEEVFFYHTDPVGTPMAMSNASGQKVWEADYKPFGEEYTLDNSPENDKRFVGKVKDEETGLNYFGARYLSAGSGRFLAPEPVRVLDEKTGKISSRILQNPQRANLYAYSLNSPYVYTDPDGLSPSRQNEFDCGNGQGVGGVGGYPFRFSFRARGQIRGPQNSSVANNINSQEPLIRKLSALQTAQQTARRTVQLPDGRIRYYSQEVPANKPGPTRGAAYVTEHDPKSGSVRSWIENYGHDGSVVRVHPKMINGQIVNSQHYPPTGAEIAK